VEGSLRQPLLAPPLALGLTLGGQQQQPRPPQPRDSPLGALAPRAAWAAPASPPCQSTPLCAP
jgi:hypothetical protein